MSPAAATLNSRKDWLDRALSLFTEVRAGESISALLLALNIFVLLASYYLLKTVRDTLILTQGGAEIKSYSSALMALLLLLVVPAYGAFAARVNRNRLLTGVTLFLISNLLVFYVLGLAGFRVGVPFYLWAGIFNVFITAQFWAFANDVYTEEQGKRLFPLVGVGASLGALLGALMAKSAFGAFNPETAPYSLMLIASVGLGVAILITRSVNRRERSTSTAEKASRAEKPLGKEGGFKLVFTQRYLFLIAVLIMLLNLVNTTGVYLLDKVVTTQFGLETASEAQLQAMIGSFWADFYSWQNLIALLLQLFLVSRVFKYIGIRGALFILPCIALGSYSLFIAVPILSVIRIAKLLENSTDYSIQNTARHALFLPTSREAKYKAKAVIDMFFWRFGDMLQAGVVFVGVQLAFAVQHFAVVNVIFVLIWFGVAAAIAREHRKLSSETV